VGVCQYPNSLTVLAPANCVSSNDFPFRVIPERGQVAKNSSKPSIKEHWHVLHDCEAWSKLANQTGNFRPQAGSLAVESITFV